MRWIAAGRGRGRGRPRRRRGRARGRSRRARSVCRRPRSRVRADKRSRPGELGVDQAADVGGELLELGGVGRVAGQVALGLAHRAGLQRGEEAELVLRADDQLGAAAADVDHEAALGRGPAERGSAVGQPGLLAAAEDARVEREALAQLGGEGARVVGVANGARRDRGHSLRSQLLVAADVVADRAADVVDRVGRELARRVDAAAQPRHAALALDLGHLVVADVRHEEAGGVRSHVDDGDSHPGPRPRATL